MNHIGRHAFWGAVCLALVLYFMGALNGASSEVLREWRTSAGLARKAQKPFVDSMRAAREREAKLLASARKIRVHVESVLVSVPRESVPASVLLVLAEQGQALDLCEAAVTTCQQRAAWAEARVDSLNSLLGKGLVVTKCKILLLPCPSRALAFMAGGVTGLLVSGVVK